MADVCNVTGAIVTVQGYERRSLRVCRETKDQMVGCKGLAAFPIAKYFSVAVHKGLNFNKMSVFVWTRYIIDWLTFFSVPDPFGEFVEECGSLIMHNSECTVHN